MGFFQRVKHNIGYLIAAAAAMVSVIVLLMGYLSENRESSKDYSGTYVSGGGNKYNGEAGESDKIEASIGNGSYYVLNIEKSGDDYLVTFTVGLCYRDYGIEYDEAGPVKVLADDIQGSAIKLKDEWNNKENKRQFDTIELTFLNQSVNVSSKYDEYFGDTLLLMKEPVTVDDTLLIVRMIFIFMGIAGCAGMILLSIRRSGRRLIMPGIVAAAMLVIMVISINTADDRRCGVFEFDYTGSVTMESDSIDTVFTDVDIQEKVYVDIVKVGDDNYLTGISIIYADRNMAIASSITDTTCDGNALILGNDYITYMLSDDPVDRVRIENNTLYLETMRLLGTYYALDEYKMKPCYTTTLGNYGIYLGIAGGVVILLTILGIVIKRSHTALPPVVVSCRQYRIAGIVYIGDTYRDIAERIVEYTRGRKVVVEQDVFTIEDCVINNPEYQLIDKDLQKSYEELTGITQKSMYRVVNPLDNQESEITYIIGNGAADYIIKLAQDMVVCVYGLEVDA